MAEKKSKKPQSPGGVRRRRKPAGTSTGLTAGELQVAAPTGEVAELHQAINHDGGKVLATYREPFSGQWVLFAALPIELVQPTPFQRNLSDSHARRLEGVIGKLGYFLDPIITVQANPTSEEGAKYWTPNGNHRLSAMRTLGAKSITALVVPNPSVAYRILALNTEKAHNLREKALEVIRMYRELASLSQDLEQNFSLEFEEPAFITLGLCYEERPRFSGGAYHPVLKRTDQFFTMPLPKALDKRTGIAKRVLELDDVVIEQVEALKKRGLTNPYLKNFVVARVNPVRFRPKEADPLSLDQALDRMLSGARKFNPEKIKMEEIARSGGGSSGEEA
jgi:ParB family chromosome partitioning protein